MGKILVFMSLLTTSAIAQEMVSDASMIKGCLKLGSISGKSMWSGVGGKNRAEKEIKQKCTNKGCDTILLVNTGAAMWHSELSGIAYKCANKSDDEIVIDEEIIRKAKECQKGGGIWINDDCYEEAD